MVKKRIVFYGGFERGASMLALKPSEAIVFDGMHYHKVNVPKINDADTKANNAKILVPKNVQKNVQKKEK